MIILLPMSSLKPLLFLLFLSVLYSCNISENSDNQRPNILLIVADDLGYSDLGCFGSEISTPNIDAIAGAGITFTNFHTSPMCAPTRGMLYTGNDNHIAGIGWQSLSNSDPRKGTFGYEGYLTDRVVPFPEILSESGYHTYLAGKWHIGSGEENSPKYKGFEHSYVLEGGGASHFDAVGFGQGKSIYRENGKEVDYPTGTYTTEVYTNKILEYIKGSIADENPFFAMATYTSPHWPLQVPDEYLDNYKGVYDPGYEKLRTYRLQALKDAQIVPQDLTLPEIPDTIPTWESLSDRQRLIESRKMELYASMVENLDHHVGRIIDYLKEIDEYDNTLIIFMSDNGAASADFYSRDGYKDFLRANYDNSYENMGKSTSWVSYGARWALSSVAAFKYFKWFSTEGGIRAPMIVKYPYRNDGLISYDFTTVQDIAPTLIDFAGAEYPSNSEYPIKGESMKLYLEGVEELVHDEEYVYALEHYGKGSVIKGNWKIHNQDVKNDPGNFGLYNILIDPAEKDDLRDQEPEKYDELMKEWGKYAEEIQLRY